MDTSTCYMANPDVSCGVEEDGALLFNPDTNDSVIINPTGQMIWDLIVTARAVEDIVPYLAQRYPNVPASQLVQDVEQFLNELLPDFIHEVRAGHDGT